MQIIHVFLLLVCLLLPIFHVICDEVEAREVQQNESENSVGEKLESVELPDSALMLFEDENIKESSPMMSLYARSNKIKNKYKDKNKTKKKTGNKQNNSTSSSDENRCKCVQGVCKCCTGVILDVFNQKACMKVTYHPGDFAFDVAMSLNDRVLYENSMSGKNPKPMCVGPPRFPNVRMCAQFYDVFFPGRNFHFCLQMNGRFGPYELFNVNFNCLRMGANGIVHMSPDENGGISYPNPQGGVDAVIDSGDDIIEEYDDTNVRSLFDLFEYR